MSLPVDLRIYHDGEEILPTSESEDSSIPFGQVRPDGRKQVDLTLRNDGRVKAYDILVTFGHESSEGDWIIDDLGVTVQMSPMDLEPEEEQPLVLSWHPDTLVLGRDFLRGNMRVDFNYINVES